MVPPQESPTFQAVSSATPNSSVLGLPLSITSRASVTTAPSTQPPETEPRKLPSSSITRFEPTGRGAEPQVSTTVASATPRPFARQSSAALRMSSSRANMMKPPLCKPSPKERIKRRPYQQIWSCHLVQPSLRIASAAAGRRKGLHQLLHRIQIVDRSQFVDMRHHRPD